MSLVLLTSQRPELRTGNASVHVSAETAIEFTKLLIKGMHHEIVSLLLRRPFCFFRFSFLLFYLVY